MLTKTIEKYLSQNFNTNLHVFHFADEFYLVLGDSEQTTFAERAICCLSSNPKLNRASTMFQSLPWFPLVKADSIEEAGKLLTDRLNSHYVYENTLSSQYFTIASGFYQTAMKGDVYVDEIPKWALDYRKLAEDEENGGSLFMGEFFLSNTYASGGRG